MTGGHVTFTTSAAAFVRRGYVLQQQGIDRPGTVRVVRVLSHSRIEITSGWWEYWLRSLHWLLMDLSA